MRKVFKLKFSWPVIVGILMATLFFAGRRRSSSPAVGQFAVHLEQQKKLVDDAISLGKSTFVEVE